jgi:hypothetical protein
MEGGEAEVTGARTVLTLALEMIEELRDERSVEIAEREFSGGFVESLLGEAQQQAEGVTVAGNSVGTGLSLCGESFGEEGLQ